MQNNLTPRYIIIAVILGWAIWSLWPTYQYQSMSEERKEELLERLAGELLNDANGNFEIARLAANDGLNEVEKLLENHTEAI